jgi:hypothetical protein
MITPVRQPAEKIFVRETEYGPEVCFDYGVNRTVVNCTEEDLTALEMALIIRRNPAALDEAVRRTKPDLGDRSG